MALNNKKIVSIILEQCSTIEDRCDSYREVIVGTITDILDYEQSHRIAATNVQKKINEKCNATAQFLAKHKKLR